MLEKRPIVVITIGYIIGIISGLYCNSSIVFLYLLLFLGYNIINSVITKPQNNKFKLLSFRRYFRYIKIIFTKKVIYLIVIISIFSNTVVIYQNYIYDRIRNNKEINIEATIVSNVKENKFKDVYKVKVNKVLKNRENNLKNKILYINVKKNLNTQLYYGDSIRVSGIFEKPGIRKNYKGFDRSQYLKTISIYGTLNVTDIKKINNNKDFSVNKLINNIFLKLKNIIQDNFNKDVSNVVLGIFLGYTDEIDENIKNDFSENNISHILAVSGMHVGYLILICKFIFDRTYGKRYSYFISIFILVFYMLIVGMSPSVIRATIMAILIICSKLLHRKSNVWNNISLSMLILLIYNPFIINNVGFILSYGGTIGIIAFSRLFRLKNSAKQENEDVSFKLILKCVKDKTLEMLRITIFVSFFLLPLVSIFFNKIPVFSIFISSMVGTLVSVIMIFIFLFIITYILEKFFIIIKPIEKIIGILLSTIVKILIKFSEIGRSIPLGNFLVVTPNIFSVLLYYLTLFIFLFIFNYKRKNTPFGIRIKNLVELFKYRYYQNKNKVISIVLVFIILFSLIKIIPGNLKIYFIDVNQGDACLVVTPTNKKILIDGGGNENYDIGKNILLPYLLDRGIKEIDYAIISHFDFDHSQSYAKILPELTASRIFITEQIEENDLFKQIMAIAKEKNIKVTYVKAGDIINIDGVKFSILHPQKELITNNGMNNNSMVCKLEYKSFSMLFTGDIEKEAEELILNKNIDIKADVLKVAHHRF